MPFVVHRGQRIHYTVAGEGPLVVLQHGLFDSAESWAQAGYVAALSRRYRVACIDSLGHGRSDKPADPALYGQAQRAGDVVAVIDALGAARAHLVGYSMGGWIAIGVARHFPGRLASLTVGGWPPVESLDVVAAAIGRAPRFAAMLAFARATAPQLVNWVRPEDEAGLQACFDALGEREGAAEAVAAGRFPALLWCGQQDVYHPPMQAFAAAHGLPLLSTPGDHLGALYAHAGEAIAGLEAFLGS
jgi:pimeloyl-ACP methyl ester carboxylesterase